MSESRDGAAGAQAAQFVAYHEQTQQQEVAQHHAVYSRREVPDGYQH